MKAKSIASDMSGEIGQSITGALNKVGGFALGAAGGVALGLGAGALRGTLGKVGDKLGNNTALKNSGAIGRGIAGIGKWAGSSSFDVRTTKLGAKATEGLSKGLGTKRYIKILNYR